MKLFRSPLAVGVLAVLAIAMVIHSLSPHLRRQTRRAAPASSPPTPAPSAAVTTLEKPSASTKPLSSQAGTASASLPPRALDLGLIHAEAERWGQGQRDPFQLRTIAAKPIYPPASEVLFLSAVWRQTDSSLAVLNNRIYAAGDRVLRYTINSIEPDRVWVQGPNGREAVGFRSAQATRTNLQQNITLGSGISVSRNP